MIQHKGMIIGIISAALIASTMGSFGFYILRKERLFEATQTAALADLADRISSFEKIISAMDESIQKITVPPKEIIRREIVREKSQDELLTDAVAKATPGVVSIVVSKDVPQLEVAYVNPFGDDPFFKDFGVRVPVYRQKGTERQKIGAGTGFIVRSNGYIITNKHVVADASAYYTVLLANGTQKNATVLYRDPTYDLAVVKIDGGGFSSIPLGDANTLKLGQAVVAIGNALGEYNNSVSVGIISGLNRTIHASDGTTSEELKDVIQTDAAINPGNSGGPLLDLSGNAIGVNVATVIGSNNISFAIPANLAKEILAKVL